MPGNNGKGGKKHRRAKKGPTERKAINYATDGQLYGLVEKKLGSRYFNVKCTDDKVRRCHVRGSMRKRVWINESDIVLISLRGFDDDNADIIHKYDEIDTRRLDKEKKLEALKNKSENGEIGNMGFTFGDAEEADEEINIDDI